MKSRKLFFAQIIGVSFLASCSTFSFDKMELGPDPMVEHVRQWTRSAKLYRQFDTTVLVDVTYNSAELRRRMVESHVMARKLGEGQKAALIEEQIRENEKYAQFYVAIYTPKSEWSRMAKSDPAWIVFVDTPSGPVFSEPAVKVDEEDLPWATSLSYDPKFRMFYQINVPRGKIGEKEIKLVLSGMLGEVYVTWEKQ
ncbi:MAG: hypothetical protein OEY50_09590 [Nitrospinota bacterium]|nr:hypothetical protein [Nitrospinota bacterium]MDH5679580.1 hypothetical protein [Nitrospinota bacterium]MDH5756022.1 hypothetical protein [Nitrospinota bacterium]